jgi:UDP-N-acetylglucosamine--N-acetylmuramyl-(pentapeptide) pyrophosphoryl-undecaprenol N-acetylglucosamine transferase
MRVLVSGGGTGGHVYPALSVAKRLREVYQAEILYLGSDDGLETSLVPQEGLPLATVKAGKLQRFLSWRTLTRAARIPIGIIQAIGIVRKFRPDVAFTSGGYVAVPTGLAARLNGVPLLMHQQDVPPNLSNRLIAPLATRISVAFADSQRYFPARKTVQLGNPLRQEMLDMRQTSPQEARRALQLIPDVPLVLVTGGSQGARHLNQVVCRALPELLRMHCQVLHISGKKLFEETRTLSESMMTGIDAELRAYYRLEPYMSAEMPLALQAAEIVLCRSGAATMSELAILGKPAILVPLAPGIGGSPQEENAAMFSRLGAAEVIRNDDLKPELLVERVKAIIASPGRLQAMSEAARGLAKPDATAEIVEMLIKIAKVAPVTTPEREVLNT